MVNRVDDNFMHRALLSLLLLTACTQPTGEHPDEWIHAAATEWTAAGLAPYGDCVHILPRSFTSEQRFANTCASTILDTSDSVEGCLTHEPWGTVINFAPGHGRDEHTQAHLLLHAVYECVYGAPDTQHSDARVWMASGGDDSVQARLRED